MTTGNCLRAIVNERIAQVDHRLFEVLSKDEKITEGLGIYLNSGLAFLCRELIGRANLGDGALDVEGIDWERIFVPKKEILLKLKRDARETFEKLSKRPIKDITTESKRKDRIEFEKAVLKSLGLPEELVNEILEGVVGLVEERHLLPKLRTAKKKKRIALDHAQLREQIIEEILPDGPIRFPEGFIKGWPRLECEEISIPAAELKLGETGICVQEICDAEGEHVMEVNSEEKGKFIIYAKKKDEVVIKVPKKHILIKKAVQEYEIYLRELKDKLFTSLMEKCGDHTVSENMTRQIFEDFNLPDI